MTLVVFELLKGYRLKSKKVLDMAEKKNVVGNIYDSNKKKGWPGKTEGRKEQFY